MNELDQENDSETQPEKELCPRCLTPNEPGITFCRQCGRPLSPYAATGPFESIFAEGDLYRQASEKPRNLVVLLGMWLIFGMMAIGGVTVICIGREDGLIEVVFGAFVLAISIILLWKTTRNYLRREKPDTNADRDT